MLRDAACSVSVCGEILGVLASVNLDGKLASGDCEIDDLIPNRVLAADSQMGTFFTQRTPHDPLGVGHCSTQFTRKLCIPAYSHPTSPGSQMLATLSSCLVALAATSAAKEEERVILGKRPAGPKSKCRLVSSLYGSAMSAGA